MRIYDLDKIQIEDVKQILIDELPKSITTDKVAHRIEFNDRLNEIKFQRFENLAFINPITISNLKIEDNLITGDISFGNKPKKSFRREEIPEIDLRGNDEYKIMFKPSFTVKYDDDTLRAESFNNFEVYLMDKSKFREERLSKLLEIK